MKDQRMTPTLSDERILDLIAAYGADPAAFPEAERAAATRRIAEAPGLFAKVLDDARRLDQFLDLVPEADVSASLRNSLLASAPKPQRAARPERGLGRFLPGWLPAGAVASLVMGIMIGVNVSLPSSVASAQTTDETDAVMYAALGFGDYELMSEAAE
ncbi:hypothetical protein [uncultured Hyphomonas sp.]|uniref:hypothetical protein n=1 Tax=uncultured Hyphomonas sp. TaxID=225298 RepID=UPI002AAB85C7|nr:hypothetical protein [uncultured Hyphomonas sp.]